MLKLVINRSYGGFSLPKGVAEELGYRYNGGDNIRGDRRLIKMVEENPDRFKDLMVVEIPWNPSDYKIVDYDGKESVIYVVNGKLHRAPVDWWCLEL